MFCFRLPLALSFAWIVLTQSVMAAPQGKTEPANKPLPNIVIIFTDDQGYSDVGCFGAEGFTTPHLDQLAKQGRRFTSFYSACPVCSGSRVALLTGAYPSRLRFPNVLFPNSNVGIAAGETTLAELAKQKGYATACFGKWHLGHHAKFLPTAHGFDRYFGVPYSNDMWIDPKAKLAKNITLREGMTVERIRSEKHRSNWVPLMRDEEVVEYPADQTTLTKRTTEEAVRFIEEKKDGPFLIYMPHSMPHTPIFSSKDFVNKSKQGAYGDVIQEIDWSVGQVLAALKKNDLDDNTLVAFMTDNGPWLIFGNHAGSARPLREGKITTFEGGMRVPCIMRWPGKIPADSQCDEIAGTIDLVPTVAHLIDAELPQHALDGKDIWPLMSGQDGAKTPHESYLYYLENRLEAIRSGPWKLHFPHSYHLIRKPGMDGKFGVGGTGNIGLELFNLESDIGESTNVADKHPEVVARLKKLADAARRDIGDDATTGRGKNTRLPDKL